MLLSNEILDCFVPNRSRRDVDAISPLTLNERARNKETEEDVVDDEDEGEKVVSRLLKRVMLEDDMNVGAHRRESSASV